MSTKNYSKSKKSPRPLSIVKAVNIDSAWRYGWGNGETFIYLGEIPNMPGHCVLYRISAEKILYAFHTENFVELTEEEI